MKCSEYFGVQFAQGHYLMHWEALQLLDITDKLFSEREPVSVEYKGFCEAHTRKDCTRLFEKLDAMRIENGGLLRVDLPHTQKITVDSDGQHAIGQWETLSMCVKGAAFGNDRIKAPLDYWIGRYTNRFVLEDSVWKFTDIYWEPVIGFGNWKAKDATKAYGRTYPKPYEYLRIVDDETASIQALTICEVRNQAIGFFNDFNHRGISAVDERFSSDAARTARKMLEAPKSDCGYHGTVLATSPIISLDKAGQRARLYLNIGRILPVDSTRIAHSRGRVCAELELKNDRWFFDEFDWYRYATMEPWDIRS